MAGLPVEVGILSHRTLNDKVAEIEIAEVVTAIAERERLKFLDARLLVGEELIIETLFDGVKSLVGIDGH